MDRSCWSSRAGPRRRSRRRPLRPRRRRRARRGSSCAGRGPSRSPRRGSPPRTRDALTSWDADEDTRFFSGVATYETTVEIAAIPRGATRGARLRPGASLEADRPRARHADVARGADPRRGRRHDQRPARRLGLVPAIPPGHDQPDPAGRNTVAIRVGNTAMNHMAGRPLPDYRLLNLRYGERFQAQGMELIRPLPSGLVGPVSLDVTPPRSR